MKYDIFISYRRDGGDTLAQLIYDRLTGRGYRVFLDIESLRSGKFNEKLLDVIEECKDVVVILPPNALDRCKNPGDWLFCEVSHAIKLRKNLVPIMMSGFTWPEDMPEGIRELADYNGITDSKNYFDAVIDKLTMILISKPTLLKGLTGKTVGNSQIPKTQPVPEKRKVGFVKWILAAVALFAVVFLCFLGIPKKEQSRTMKSEAEPAMEENTQTDQGIPADLVYIVMTPEEDMGVPDYQRAMEVIEKRVQILAKDSYYEYREEDGQITIGLSATVLGKGEDIRESVKTYISRPMKLFFMSNNLAQGYLTVSPEDIVDITIRQGKIRYVDPREEYRFEAGKDNTYFHIVFTEEMNQQIQEKFGKCESYCIAQDFGEHGLDARFFTLMKAKMEEGYYFADDNQMANINELLLYNFTEESFSHSMLVDVRYPIEWEVVSEAENKGVNQCNEEEITGEQMVIYYQPASHVEEVTQGEAMDVMMVAKHRLDALGIPYAFGYTKNREHEFAVKIGIDKIGNMILNMLVQSWPSVEMYHPYMYLSGIGSELETVQKEDGTYALGYTRLKEDDIEKLREDFEKIIKSQNTNLYLTYGSMGHEVLSKIEIERIFEDLNRGEILFDNLIGLGMDGITEENKYLADFFVALNKQKMPESYEVFSYYFENVEDFNPGLEILPVKNEYLADKVAEYMEKIRERYPKAEVSVNSIPELEIRMGLSLDDKTPQAVVDIMKDLYHNCGLKEGEISYSIWVYETEETQIEIEVAMNRLNYEGQYYEVYIWGNWAEEVKTCVNEFERLTEQDAFFRTCIAKYDPDVLYDFSIFDEEYEF